MELKNRYKVKKDKVIVLDVEKTCWEGGIPPIGQESEIIQFGLTEVDIKSLEIKRTLSIFVKPKFSTVSEYCTNLTGITQKILNKQGVDLVTAGKKLERDFGVGSKAWFAWGSDKKDIDYDFKKVGLISPFSDQFFDFGLYFTLCGGYDKSLSLLNGLEKIDLSFEGRQHDGLNDAINTANLLIDIMKKTRNYIHEPKNEFVSSIKI